MMTKTYLPGAIWLFAHLKTKLSLPGATWCFARMINKTYLLGASWGFTLIITEARIIGAICQFAHLNTKLRLPGATWCFALMRTRWGPEFLALPRRWACRVLSSARRRRRCRGPKPSIRLDPRSPERSVQDEFVSPNPSPGNE